MADPHVILAPLVEPPLPPVPAAAPEATLPWLLLLGLGSALIVLALLAWAWRRRAPQRALRRIARQADAVQGAHQLAHWQRRHAPAMSAEWQQALERLRFGPADDAAAATLQRLCAQAAQARRAG